MIQHKIGSAQSPAVKINTSVQKVVGHVIMIVLFFFFNNPKSEFIASSNYVFIDFESVNTTPESGCTSNIELSLT